MRRYERILQATVYLLALDSALGGAVLLFGGRTLFVWLFPFTPPREFSDLLLFKQRTWGGLGIGLALMLNAAARDPRRNAIVIWGMAVALAIAGLAELSSLWLLGANRVVPTLAIVPHALVRIGLAILLVYLERRLLAEPAPAEN